MTPTEFHFLRNTVLEECKTWGLVELTQLEPWRICAYTRSGLIVMNLDDGRSVNEQIRVIAKRLRKSVVVCE